MNTELNNIYVRVHFDLPSWEKATRERLVRKRKKRWEGDRVLVVFKRGMSACDGMKEERKRESECRGWVRKEKV